MQATINDTELQGVERIEVELQREVDRFGLVQAHLATPVFRVEREIGNVNRADIVAFESFADIGVPATVELEFSSGGNTIMEIKLTDVMIDRPVLDYQVGKVIEAIHGRGGTLELVTPPGDTYIRDTPLHSSTS